MSDSSPNPNLNTLLKHSGWVRALARALVADPAAADDVEQRAWLAAMERPPEHVGSPRAWLGTVVRNIAGMHWREQKARRRREALVGERRWEEESGKAPNAQPDALVERMDTFRKLAVALASLDEPYGTTLYLRFFEELTIREIALRMKMPDSTAKARITRGLKMLRYELESSIGQDWRQHCLAFTLPLATAPTATIPTVLTMTLKAKLIVAAASIAFASLLLLKPWTFLASSDASVEKTQVALLYTGAGFTEADPPLAEANQVKRTNLESQPEHIFAEPLDPDFDLSGIVVDSDGQPIVGARLEVLRPLNRHAPNVRPFFDQAWHSIALLESDTEGRFRVRLQPHITFDLDVKAAGFGAVRYVDIYAGTTLRIELAQSAVMRGSVTHSKTGTPLQGVRVIASPGILGFIGRRTYETETDADGRYVLLDLPTGIFSITTFADGFLPAPPTTLVLKAEQDIRRDISLDPGGTIHGRIFDANTQLPIVGARVRSYLTRGQEAITDADGRYVLAGVSPTYPKSINASAPGYGRYDFPVKWIPEDGLKIDLGLLPGRTVRGKIINRNGLPIADAYLAASGDLWRREYGDTQSDRLYTRSDADGQFVMKDLRVDVRHTLFVVAQGYGSEVFDFPDVEWSSNELDLGEITLNQGASISGRVLDIEGDPIAGMWVDLSGESARRNSLKPFLGGNQGYRFTGGFGMGKIGARTDALGRYVLADLPTGKYRLWAGAKGYARGAEADIALMRGEQVEDFDLTLDAGLFIRGTVVDQNGKPVPRQSVSLGTPDDPYAHITYDISRENGSFELAGLEPGSFTLWLWPSAISQDAFGKQHYFAQVLVEDVASGSDDVRVVLPEAVATSGVVLDPDGNPVSMVNVSINNDNMGWMLDTTNAKGEFTVWLESGKAFSLRFYPAPEHSYMSFAYHYDDDGEIDMSYEHVVDDIVAGSQDLVITLPTVE